MSSTSEIGGTPPAATPAAAPAATSNRAAETLGRDAFLQLLTTQLAHQDPLKPQSDTEFIAQLAQFSSLEQLTQMRASLDLIAAALVLPAPAGEQETS